jgi:CRISPR-associated endonuclease/helicase Cas3
MLNLPSYMYFWGKAAPDASGARRSHPVAYHCLDVAAVADVLLRRSPRKLCAISRLLATSPDNARDLLVSLIALHDVGKFSAAFQAKSKEAWPSNILGEHTELANIRHDELGSALRGVLDLKALFAPALGLWSPGDFADLWHAVAGHHGQPRVSEALRNIPGMNAKCLDAARAFCTDMVALLAAGREIPRPELRNLPVLSWVVAGLTVIADWIGSNRTWFPYCKAELTAAEYWPEALGKADVAVSRAGILPAPLPEELTTSRLLGKIAQSLSPLQQHVLDLALPQGPMLAIIEDVTGSGKTEAALLLAARLLADHRADGLFFALPTMATANAMYERLQENYRRLFADGAQPSLVLAHGKRKLHAGFSASILESPENPGSADDGYEEGGGASCAAWIADDRRKAFLAHVGVGTIDQALLSALPSRHQSLRLWGLSDRVLIVDEAHAYDAYMSKEIETLLEFQAALGGSAIVLSATLPGAQRRAVLAAFARGLEAEPQSVAGEGYPLMTVVSGTGTASRALRSRADRARILPVQPIGTIDQATTYIEAMARRGAAVAWIRNAVDDAIEAAHLLERRGLAPVLLHARFAMGDRLDIEERVRTTLGRGDGRGERRGFVVVGTQILEQSLDYDVDAMITDLAPIDLVIQRAGRLWRHTNRANRPVEAPQLLVLSPDPAQVKDRDWYRTLSGRAAAVYNHHGIVWRSAKALFESSAIKTPGGIRGLVEQVYGREDLDDIPEPLRTQSQRAEGERSAARSHANTNLLKLREGYGGCSTLWTSDMITPTRLGEPVAVFRLGKIEDGRIVPWYDADEPARAWALSFAVRLRYVIGPVAIETYLPAADSVASQLVASVKRALLGEKTKAERRFGAALRRTCPPYRPRSETARPAEPCCPARRLRCPQRGVASRFSLASGDQGFRPQGWQNNHSGRRPRGASFFRHAAPHSPRV